MSAIRVLFGTETYNSQDLADRTAEAIEALNLPVEVFDMADVEVDDLADAVVLLVITSTFGDGEPPSNAQALHEALKNGGPALGHVRYAVCALGDRGYPRFCQCGKDFDRFLAARGAVPLLPRVDCDADFEKPFAGWLKGVLAGLKTIDFSAVSSQASQADSWAEPSSAGWSEEAPSGSWPADEGWPEASGSWPAEPQAAAPAARVSVRNEREERAPARAPVAEPARAAEPARTAQSPYRYFEGDAELATHAFIRIEAPLPPPPTKGVAAVGTRKQPYVATVLENYNLNEPGSDKETRHVAFSLKGAGISYTVGDALGVVPNNCPDLVRRIVQGAALRGDEPVEVGGEVLPLRAALTYRLDCTHVDRKLLELAARSGHPQVAHQFALLVENEEARKGWLAQHHVIDLVEAAWMRTDAQALVKTLKPLGPRLYSISSSPLAHPGEVHITVDVLRYELHGRLRKGTSSSFISERCGPGVRVPIFIQPSKFGLVADEDPIIMVGPGTGIAPFRAFLEEREARGSTGYSWLFFGARSATTDFLYREQIAAWQASGVLTRFDTAFSRDQADKIYVQDRMREHGADLFAWLEAGSIFYVCGDATRMARDVHEALLDIIAYHGGLSREGAVAYLDQMQADGRYQRDIY